MFRNKKESRIFSKGLLQGFVFIIGIVGIFLIVVMVIKSIEKINERKKNNAAQVYSIDSLSLDPVRLLSGYKELKLTGKVSILRFITDTMLVYAEYNDSVIKCLMVARADQLILKNQDSIYKDVKRSDLQARFYPWQFFDLDSVRIPVDRIKFLRAVK